MHKEIKSGIAITIILFTSILLSGLLLKKIASDRLAMTAPIMTYSVPREIHEATTPTPGITADNASKKITKEVGTVATISNVQWTTPKQIDNLQLTTGYGIPNPSYYVVGKISDGAYKDSDVILNEIPFDGAGGYTTFLRFIRFQDNYILLSRYIPDHEMDYVDLTDFGSKKIVSAPNIIIKDLEFPKTITAPDGKIYAFNPESLAGDESVPYTLPLPEVIRKREHLEADNRQIH